MRTLLIASAIALTAMSASTYSYADDAHHPDKAATAKQSKAKPAPKKKTPPSKSERTNKTK